MEMRPDQGTSSSRKGTNTGIRLAKNSAALFVVAIFTTGAKLIVTILVARYLGPAALGTFAVVMGLAEVFKLLAPLGQRTFVIREVARDRSRMFSHWLNASLITFSFSLVLVIALIVIVHLVGFGPEALTSSYVAALFLPLAGLYLVARAAIQGLERMEYLTIAAFVGRVFGLLVLWILLESGVGVEAAFIGNGLFQLVALLILIGVILRIGRRNLDLFDWRPRIDLWRTSVGASLPFAFQDGLSKIFTRVNTIILPLLVTMATVGIFNAADRVRQASAIVVPMITIAILPTLSSAFLSDRGRPAVLMKKAIKMLLIVVLPYVAIIAVAADQIIPLLYGPGYEAAVPVLRVIIWSQVFFVVDAVFIQAMVASDNERPMVRRTALSLGANVVLTLVLVPTYGILGAAWAVVLSRILSLGLNAQFVRRQITHIKLIGTVGKPLLCAALAAGVAVILRNQELYVLLIVSAITYILLLLMLRVFSRDELLMVRDLSARFWQRLVVLRR